jgi:hypothetical protein
MFKKIFYSLTILAMLFGMFGVMGTGGVQKAAAYSGTAIVGNVVPALSTYDYFAGPPAPPAGLHFHGYAVDFNTMTAEAPDPATTCIADPSAHTAWVTVETGANAHFLHLHASTAFDATVAVFADNSGLGVELGCQNTGAINTDGLHNADLVIAAAPLTTYHVYLAPRAFGGDPLAVPAGDREADLWIAQFRFGSGIIANLCETNQPGGVSPLRCDQASEPVVAATVQAQLSTGGTIHTDWFDWAGNTLQGLGVWTSTGNGDLFIDVPDAPAGASWTLGISSLNDTLAPFTIDTIWFIPAVGSFLALDPDDSTSYKDSLFAAHSFLNRAGVGVFNPAVFVAAAGGVLPNFELAVDETVDFRIIPGGFYDFEATAHNVADFAGLATDYYLVSRGVDCLNVLATCRLAFDTRDVLPGAFAHPHASIDRNENLVNLPPPPLFVNEDWNYLDFAVGATGTNFATSEIYTWVDNDDIVVSAGVPLYMDAEANDYKGDQWVMQATTPGPIPSTMVANTRATPLVWRLLWDVEEGPFDLTDNFGELFTTLTAPGMTSGIVTEVPWASAAGPDITASWTTYNDFHGNILIARSPIDNLPIDYYPDFWDTPSGGVIWHRETFAVPFVVANEILGANLGEVNPAYVAGSLAVTGLQIGRHIVERCIDDPNQAGLALDWFAIHFECPQLLHAISATDTRMSGHWAWSWVEGMYELDLTTGTAPGVYSPDMTIKRAEMAVFLSRLLSGNSAIPPAGAGTGLVYTDVLAGFWAAGNIEQLNAYNISGDCNPALAGAQFCPDGMVSRAEMAKFIEQTFRVAVANGMALPDGLVPGVPFWDVNFNVITPGTIFVDVPAGNWAAIWTDEMWLDGLTEGCRTEMSGFAFIHYYCPDDPVTRGQMAKFIVSAFAPTWDIRDGWPILAPER